MRPSASLPVLAQVQQQKPAPLSLGAQHAITTRTLHTSCSIRADAAAAMLEAGRYVPSSSRRRAPRAPWRARAAPIATLPDSDESCLPREAEPIPAPRVKCEPYLRAFLTSDPAAGASAPVSIDTSWPTKLPFTRGGKRPATTHASKVSSEEVLGLLRKSPLFSRLAEEELEHVVREAQPRPVNRYEVLIRQGLLGSTLYLLLEGELHCFSDRGIDVIMHRPGDVVGEAALVARCPRAANVVAETPCRLLCWQHDQLVGLNLDRDEAKSKVISQALLSLPFFSNLPMLQLRALGEIMQVDTYKGGSVIFGEGELEDSLFLLLEGAVNVYDGEPPPPYGPGPGDAQLISRYDANSVTPWVGEMALWANKPPNASVVATVGSKLLVLSRASFEKFMAAMPEFRQLFTAHSNAFGRLAQLTQTKQELLGKGSGGKPRPRGASFLGSALTSWAAKAKDPDAAARSSQETAQMSVPELLRVRRWERLALGVLNKGKDKDQRLASGAAQMPSTFSLTPEAFAFNLRPRRPASPDPLLGLKLFGRLGLAARPVTETIPRAAWRS